ncbi:MAG: YkgJ family cysteine cluster protein [Cytophagales bacterium]|nr:YkgJ family cysteine cluster protein [Cytophagales bacterium]
MDDINNIMQVFYDKLNTEVAVLTQMHKNRLICKKGCFQCCVSGITLYEAEAYIILIRNFEFFTYQIPNRQGTNCTLLDSEGACRIYAARPYVCRSQGLPLRRTDMELLLEYRDICPLNDTGIPIEQLPQNECLDTDIYDKILALLQIKLDHNAPRVPLENLFYTSTQEYLLHKYGAKTNI